MRSELPVRAASLRGARNRARTVCCQDAYGVWQGDGRLVACVADGVGSQPQSHLGAREACRLLGALPYCLDSVLEINSALVDFATSRGIPPVHVSTTLTAALLDRETLRCSLVCVGDSPVWLLRAGRWHPLLGSREPGTVTDALPSPAPRATTADLLLEPQDLLVLCTDGFGDVLRESGPAAWLAERWRNPPGWPGFHADLRIAPEHVDDRSAVCVWIDPGTLQADGAPPGP
ncbi:protein phosphatase 2C domain-containing protein [Nonomuraea sp. NPDC050556]|uniref:protein phosphatase 2C domain-containing protein n=1 Tax=Nonomuraea sp. NPDC050556 TaxID=3364369 RepID=UPI0037989C69